MSGCRSEDPPRREYDGDDDDDDVRMTRKEEVEREVKGGVPG